MSFLQSNLDIVKARWPKLYQAIESADLSALTVESEQNTLIINNIQLTTNYDHAHEAALQLSRIPTTAESAFIYGTGLGDTARLALRNKNLKNIHIIVLNIGVFAHVMNALDHTDWLNAKEITLHHYNDINEVYAPFCANPAELTLASDECATLKDRILLELNQSYIESKQALPQVAKTIENNLSFINSDKSIAALPKSKSDIIYIAAAGPTLENHLSWLAENKPFIIAVDASVKTLLAHRITPDIVVSIDALAHNMFNQDDYNKLAAAALVYFPSISTHVVEQWQGKRYFSYSNTPMYQAYKSQINSPTLFSAGSVIHPAIDLAAFIGGKSIVLLGADFAFTKNKSHANPEKSAESKTPLNFAVEFANDWVFNGHGEKVATMPNLKGYLRDLERYIDANSQIKFLNGSLEGAQIAGTSLWQAK
ncbi:motility associated factor glycosyltransferase family protein [Thalassotalea euphylliae]|uniref:DUF115 domain-containing protein n=1 Tax=Thalassotalea euphylliae TaxID=1655234 RepID=A0A3E0UDN3_9GAMM|nr:6-hydroxymethylpterin diphosphokinase MptE-like protein [Thalassotalea euphylliae]REL34824.1 DUF115 domain-containing protein [Thalassotalea euphylliae]